MQKLTLNWRVLSVMVISGVFCGAVHAQEHVKPTPKQAGPVVKAPVVRDAQRGFYEGSTYLTGDLKGTDVLKKLRSMGTVVESEELQSDPPLLRFTIFVADAGAYRALLNIEPTPKRFDLRDLAEKTYLPLPDEARKAYADENLLPAAMTVELVKNSADLTQLFELFVAARVPLVNSRGVLLTFPKSPPGYLERKYKHGPFLPEKDDRDTEYDYQMIQFKKATIKDWNEYRAIRFLVNSPVALYDLWQVTQKSKYTESPEYLRSIKAIKFQSLAR